MGGVDFRAPLNLAKAQFNQSGALTSNQVVVASVKLTLKPSVLQGALDSVVRYRESKLLVQPHDEVARAPAHHTIDRRDRSLTDDPGQLSGRAVRRKQTIIETITGAPPMTVQSFIAAHRAEFGT